MMRSIQLPFLMEETLELIGNQQRVKPNNETERPRAKSSKERVRAGFRHLLAILDKALECDGPNSIANLERMMRGTRSLAK